MAAIPAETLSRWQDELAGAAPEAILRWAARTFPGRVTFATSLGIEDQALTAMLAESSAEIPVFTLDTGRLFEESYQLIERTEDRYSLPIQIMFPQREAVEAMVAEHGVNLFRKSVELRKHCCGVRKIEPLRRALAGHEAWITGLRREQSVTRGDLQAVEWDAGNGLVKINPLIDWTEQQVWDYVRAHDVPYNPLHDQGFPSIGCACCTRAIQPGEDVRAGRWWWEQPEHKECGLHSRPGLARS